MTCDEIEIRQVNGGQCPPYKNSVIATGARCELSELLFFGRLELGHKLLAALGHAKTYSQPLTHRNTPKLWEFCSFYSEGQSVLPEVLTTVDLLSP